MLTDMMDETEKMEFESIISNSEIILLNSQLYIEIKEILKELYLNSETRKKIKNINYKNITYALQNFAIANTRKQIQMPKSYFKKCILSALDQTELSLQYDANTIMDQMSNDEGG